MSLIVEHTGSLVSQCSNTQLRGGAQRNSDRSHKVLPPDRINVVFKGLLLVPERASWHRVGLTPSDLSGVFFFCM